ncbi:GMC oxidoreductase [Polyporus arcularius HHB13444]|uniref:GMC oxidoreductase n=1 Tax=Polyporus arcularius HHB13444 TaxID=1314778 RepID=A0A5C3PXB9_9APHY|nr:GMC oxidoreductase [Polyporus arcularius HHB13444]
MLATIGDVKDKSFDYIVCGGGTAGLTLAARLSEDPDTTVLVLEAGAANFDDMAILRPASYGSHFGNAAYAWDHNTIKQKLTGDNAHMWARGKGLGGSSGINFLCWIKPPAEDIDDIERLGNPGWNWNNFEKYIQRTEGFVPPTEDFKLRKGLKLDASKMGTEGPLKIAYPATIEDAEQKVEETLINAGLSAAARPMNGQPHGTYFAPLTYDPKTHTRSYAATAFYLPNQDRPNLTVLVNAHVNRVVPASASGPKFVAESVEFKHEDQIYVVRAKKEVVLSTGSVALKSPQILELSGIGNPNLLRRIGVTTKVDLPGVGTNVQEHMIVGVSFELRDDVKFDTLDLLGDPEVAAKHLELHSTGEGLFTTGIIGFSFANLGEVTPRASEIIKAAEDKIMKNANSYPPGLLEQYKISLERLKNGVGCEFISFPGLNSRPNPPEKGKRYISFYVAMNHAFSRGTIHATSKDPSVDPEFDPRYFDEEVDLQVWVEMVKFCRNLRNISPLKEMTTKEHNPGPDVQTDEQIVDWIKQVMSTTWHTASSCSMLPKANGGVVDPQLKVYGTENLRVVDLSVLPLHIAAHPQAAVYAIAEQGADIIKGKFQL